LLCNVRKPAGVDGRPTLATGADTIQRAGNDPRRRRLTHAAHPGQNKGMRDTVFADGIGNGAHKSILAHQLAEILGPVFARQHAIGGGVPRRGPRACSARRRHAIHINFAHGLNQQASMVDW